MSGGGTETVLLTGFGPFLSHKVNASWEAVKETASLGVQYRGKEVKLEKHEIPVVYEIVSKEIPPLLEKLDPILCVHVGVSPYNCIKIEKFGRNFGYNKGDINCRLPVASSCRKDGPDKIRTVFNVEEVLKCVNKKQPDVEMQISEDAGRYLCDFIYYTSLYHGKVPVVFIHVPPLDKPYSKAQLGATLKHIIETLLTHIGEGKVTNDYEIH